MFRLCFVSKQSRILGRSLCLFALTVSCAPAPIQLPPKPLAIAALNPKQRAIKGFQSLSLVSTKVNEALAGKQKVDQQVKNIYITINRYKSALTKGDVDPILQQGAEYYRELASLKLAVKQLENALQDAKNAKKVVKEYYTIVAAAPLRPWVRPPPQNPPLFLFQPLRHLSRCCPSCRPLHLLKANHPYRYRLRC